VPSKALPNPLQSSWHPIAFSRFTMHCIHLHNKQTSCVNDTHFEFHPKGYACQFFLFHHEDLTSTECLRYIRCFFSFDYCHVSTSWKIYAVTFPLNVVITGTILDWIFLMISTLLWAQSVKIIPITKTQNSSVIRTPFPHSTCWIRVLVYTICFKIIKFKYYIYT